MRFGVAAGVMSLWVAHTESIYALALSQSRSATHTLLHDVPLSSDVNDDRLALECRSPTMDMPVTS